MNAAGFWNKEVNREIGASESKHEREVTNAGVSGAAISPFVY